MLTIGSSYVLLQVVLLSYLLYTIYIDLEYL